MGSPRTAGMTRRWRVIRQILVFAAVLAFLGVALYKAMTYLKSDTGSPKATSTPCVVSPNSKAAPTYTVRVNIFNATNRAGLAAEVAQQFKARGFLIGKVANDPLNRKVTASAEVRYGVNGPKEALAVSNQVSGAKKVKDTRKDASVDFVLGNAFAELKPAPTCTAPTPTNT